MKAKTKTVLLVGVTTPTFTEEVAEKTAKRILVYDKTRLDLELMDLPR